MVVANLDNFTTTFDNHKKSREPSGFNSTFKISGNGENGDFETLFFKTHHHERSGTKSKSSRSKHRRSNSRGGTKKSKRASLERPSPGKTTAHESLRATTISPSNGQKSDSYLTYRSINPSIIQSSKDEKIVIEDNLKLHVKPRKSSRKKSLKVVKCISSKHLKWAADGPQKPRLQGLKSKTGMKLQTSFSGSQTRQKSSGRGIKTTSASLTASTSAIWTTKNVKKQRILPIDSDQISQYYKQKKRSTRTSSKY